MYCGLISYHCDKMPDKKQLNWETVCFGSEDRDHSGKECVGLEKTGFQLWSRNCSYCSKQEAETWEWWSSQGFLLFELFNSGSPFKWWSQWYFRAKGGHLIPGVFLNPIMMVTKMYLLVTVSGQRNQHLPSSRKRESHRTEWEYVQYCQSGTWVMHNMVERDKLVKSWR